MNSMELWVIFVCIKFTVDTLYMRKNYVGRCKYFPVDCSRLKFGAVYVFRKKSVQNIHAFVLAFDQKWKNLVRDQNAVNYEMMIGTFDSVNWKNIEYERYWFNGDQSNR